MPARFNVGRRSSLARLSGSHWAKERRTSSNLEPHGVWLYTGPKGSGKSLLAHAHSHMLSTGSFLDRNGKCICGETRCAAIWNVYTMHESPTLPEYGAWAKRLDLGELMDVGGEGQTHIVVYIDEITQYLNSRRGMLTEVIKLINRITFTRKGKIIFIGTGISIDWIDIRLRDQATQIFNCWTPNKGITVWANVHRLSVGHLPPHMRRLPPETRWWPTKWAWGLYNTDELIDASADFAAARTEPFFYVQTASGVWSEMKHSEALAQCIEDVLEEGITRITPDQLIDRIKQRYADISISPHWVREWLQGVGFQRGEGHEFILGSLMLGEGAKKDA